MSSTAAVTAESQVSLKDFFIFLALVVAKKNLECELNAAALLTAAWRHKRGAADGEAAVVAGAKSQQENHLLPHLQKQA